MTNENKRKIIEYRLKHPRCKYCKFKKFIGRPYYYYKRYECLVDKTIFIDSSIFYHIRGCFCDYFEVEEINEI